MNYKQTLFFVAKCLTLDQHPEKIAAVKTEIHENRINWEEVVKLSSGQFVMPALYLQFKRNGLLPDLPEDLVEYLEDITNKNRARNLAILEQTKEIISLLQPYNITPVFLKGVAHLLEGLYTDIGERMIGDIDFLVPENNMVEAAEILIKNGYTPGIEYKPEMFAALKHFPRLQNFNQPAAVEIHKELMKGENKKLLHGFEILRDKQPLASYQNLAFIPSIPHQIIHNVFNAQLNDSAHEYCDVLLRQMYDLILLSLKEDVLVVAKNHGKKFNVFNCYYATTAYVFSVPQNIIYQKTAPTDFYIKKIDYFISHPKTHQFYRTIQYLLSRFSKYISIPIRSIYRKDTRKLLFYRLTDRSWYGEHLKSYNEFFKH